MNRMEMCPCCADSVPLDRRGRLTPHPSRHRDRTDCPASRWPAKRFSKELRRMEVAR